MKKTIEQVNRKYLRGTKGFHLEGTKTAFRNYRKYVIDGYSFFQAKKIWERRGSPCMVIAHERTELIE